MRNAHVKIKPSLFKVNFHVYYAASIWIEIFLFTTCKLGHVYCDECFAGITDRTQNKFCAYDRTDLSVPSNYFRLYAHFNTSNRVIFVFLFLYHFNFFFFVDGSYIFLVFVSISILNFKI